MKKPLKNILFLPLTLPHLVSGIALLLLFGNLGIGEFLDKYLDISFIYTQKGIVLAQCFVNLPLTIKVILMSLDEINDKMVFVARTLGCNEYQSFKFVVLPSLKNGILSSAVMTWSKALGEFGAVIMVAGTTRMKTEILPTAIFLNMSTGDLDIAIGISVILIFLSIISLVTFEILTNKNKVHKTKYVKN
ncbi:MAG: ABC transporter permease [Oscillospiraceae bacterium]